MTLSPRGSSLEHLSIRAEAPHLATVGEPLEADPVRLLGRRVPDRDLRDRQRHLLLDDAAWLRGLRIAALVALHAVHVLDDHTIAVQHLDDGAARALVAAREHDDRIAFFDFLHSTSGASEMIFMNCWVRSSRVTGPKMRVPIGSSLLVSSTAALPSKRMSEPSGRRTPRRVRTTTAS